MMPYHEMIGPEYQFKRYKSFRGPNHEQMQQLLTGIIKSEEGISVDIPRWPLSYKQLMELRLGRSGARDDIIEARHNYIHTTTAVLPNPNGSGEFKFVNQYPLIYTLNSERTHGGSEITQTQYDNCSGFTVTVSQAKEFRKRAFALPEIRRELLNYLAEGDYKLAQAYIKDVESVPNLDLGEESWIGTDGSKLNEWKFNENALGLIPPQNYGMRLLLVGAYGDYTRAGDLKCDEPLVNRYFGYLIGKAAWPESSSENDVGKKSLTEKIRSFLKIKKG